jgi:hypothetical protein
LSFATPYRSIFFSREEERPHVHGLSCEGEAKFWLEPTVALAHFEGLNQRQLKLVHRTEERCDEVRKARKDDHGDLPCPLKRPGYANRGRRIHDKPRNGIAKATDASKRDGRGDTAMP